MLPYFITIAIVLFFSFEAERTEKASVGTLQEREGKKPATVRVLLFIAVAALVFTAGFRYDIGTDFQAYYKAESYFGGRVWEKIRTLEEPGMAILIEIVSRFSHDGAAYIFAFSLLTVGLSTAFLLRYCENYTTVMMLYIFCGCWHGSFNGVRQYLAAAAIIVGHRFILDKKPVKYFLCVFIAFLFHKTSIVMVVPYFIMRNKITIRNVVLLAAGTLIVAMNYDTIFSLIGTLKEKQVVMNTYATASVNTLRILANCAPAIFAVALNYKKDLTDEETFYINGLIVNAAAMAAASNSTYLARIGIYTGFFIPIGIPKTIHFESRTVERYVRLGIVVLFFIFWYVEVSGYPSLNPFHWSWDTIEEVVEEVELF